MGRPLLSRLRRRFAPLRGTQRRCAALFFAPPGRYAPCALRAQPFWKHEKNAPFQHERQKDAKSKAPHRGSLNTSARAREQRKDTPANVGGRPQAIHPAG